MFTALIERLSEFDDATLDARIRELELEQRRLAAEQAAAIAVAESRRLHTVDGHHSTTGYLRATCHWSSAEASRIRRRARLVDTMPEAGQRMLDGRLGIGQADEMARARSNPRCGDRLGEVAPMLLDHAEFLSFDDLRVCVRRWETLADRDGSHRDRDRSVEDRSAASISFGAGIDLRMSGGDALTAAELIAIHEAATELEFRRDVETRRERHGDNAGGQPLPRTAGQRRFDAVVNLFRRAVNCDNETPLEPTVDIMIDERTFHETAADHSLAPAPDPDGDIDPADRRCESSTGIVVHPDDAMRAALWGHVRRVVIDSAGIPTEHGRRNRLYTGTLREMVKLMTRRCSHPGCTVPATVAEVDHMAEWGAHGGPTEAANGDARCGFHNRLKNAGYRTCRDTRGRVLTFRPDGAPMIPAGQSAPVPRNIDLRYRKIAWPGGDPRGADPPPN